MTSAVSSTASDTTRRPAYVVAGLLALILAAAAALRFYGLGWGAPYGEFHWDEHFVFAGANALRSSMRDAAMSGKFFMYGPLPMHLLNGLVWIHDHVVAPIDLTNVQDQVTYMVMGRAISASLGTATVLLVFFIAKRLSNETGGLLASALLATTVMHISESHSFRVDLTMIFFATLVWLFTFRIVETGRWSDYLAAGAAAGAAIGSKYSAAFTLGVIAVAHLMAPNRPRRLADAGGWARWVARGVSPLGAALAVFALVNPMAFLYPDRFWQDINEQIVSPLSGGVTPIWLAQFTDIQPQAYWFTTNLWWSMGPALEVAGLAGIVWLILRWTPSTLLAASFPLLYFLSAGGALTPMARYTLPLTPAFAVSAGALCGMWLALARARARAVPIAITVILVATTSGYAVAYMNVYRQPDARLEASRYLEEHVPAGARILVEPSHGTPPTGSYLKNPQFQEYVLWDTREQRDYYTLYSLDTYRRLYDRNVPQQRKRDYIHERLALVDYVLMDDFYLQMYRHLPDAEYGPVKYYYHQLFSGELGFDLMATFKTYPSLFGREINDDSAELSSRMNDHPRVYIFKRRTAQTDTSAAGAGSPPLK